ncbi:MAG: hypothetical protein OEU89_00035 [Burkholderiaceae bacterium]|jgi:hypothetical protein|nr:hypothetical protein [Burkholderiaceae bacterium]
MRPLERRLLDFLESLDMRFQRHGHAPVFNSEEAQREVTLAAGVRATCPHVVRHALLSPVG